MNDSIGSTYLPHKNLSEFLPNVRHAFRDSPDGGQPVTDSVVLGRVTEVARDRGFIETGRGATAGRPGAGVTTYDDPAADWRTVRLTVEVDEVLAGPEVEALTVDVALMGNATTGEDDSQAECAFADLGAVALFSKANPGGPEFLGIPRHFPDEAFGVAEVDTSGRLHFPFAAASRAGRTSKAFTAEVDTVDALRREVSKPDRQVLHDG